MVGDVCVEVIIPDVPILIYERDILGEQIPLI